jgi:murein DD-endopeptidase MepM/ murein hydrolase activator NlpD
MRSRPWMILLGGAAPGVRVRSVPLPRALTVVLLAVTLAGLGGAGRLTFFAGKYLYARLGLEYLRKEHTDLVRGVHFLHALAQKHADRLENLAAAEDFVRLKYGMNAISDEVREAGVGGSPSAEELVASLLDVPVVRYADSVRHFVDGLLRRAEMQNTTLGQAVSHARRQRERWTEVPSIMPVSGRITSPFGVRVHPFLHSSAFHEGIDIANNEWTPIRATADGIIASVGYRLYYGMTVDINHFDNGYLTRYAHLVQPAVTEGQLVRRGDLIGYMGKTGRATGPHLHYEVHKDNRLVDPMHCILPADIIVD